MPLRTRKGASDTVQLMTSDRTDPRTQNGLLGAQQRAVADLGLLAVRERSLVVLLDAAAILVRDALQTDFSKILQLEPDDQLLVSAGSGWPEGVVGHLEFPASGDSPAAFALRSHEPVIVPDMLVEARFTPEPVLLELGVRSSVNVIVEGPQRPFGVLEVDARVPREYTSDEIAFLQLVANILSSALERQGLDEERERFLSLAAHELRTPITSILGFSQRALRRARTGFPLDEGAVGELQTLHEEAKRLQLTVTQLGDLARIGHGLTADLEPVSVSRLLQELVVAMRTRYPRIEFLEPDAQEELVIDSDPSLLERALLNLLDNAAKYSAPGARVGVRAEATADRVVVGVRDQCGGLSETRIARLFEPYYRGSPRHRASGLGIGLYVVKEVAAALGGSVNVRDIADEGCEFVLELPYAPEL